MKRMVLLSVSILCLLLSYQTVTEAATGVYYGFESDTEGWAAEEWGYGTPTLTWNADQNLQLNTGTVNVDASDWAKIHIRRDQDETLNLAGNPAYSMNIFIPSNAYYVKAKLTVRSGNNWDFWSGQEFELENNNTWQMINWDLSGASNLSDVRQIGVELQGFLGEDPAFYIDDVTAGAVPEPSSIALLAGGILGLAFLTRKK
ncbi:MAG: PEP-CTERM sorting domain-containing protein [bacterium]|nr:PEP-CTERM sorting domain-containing protein [bacterium]